MTISQWFHHLFNPHCEECARDRECKSCDTLKEQLAIERQFNKMLMDKLTQKNAPEETTPVAYEPIPPKHIPWRVKQQALEAESRQAAAILKKKLDEMAPGPERGPSGGIKSDLNRMHVSAPSNPTISTEDLEKELDIVEEERENNVRNTRQGS